MRKELFWELIFPARCGFCDSVLPWGRELVCKECESQITYVKEPVCCKCGKPVKEEEEFCFDCSTKEHEYIRGAALFEYSFIKGSLYRFKYQGREEYARVYGHYMAHHFKDRVEFWKPQALIPVPIHKKRRRKRGYNQAELIARELEKYWKIPMITDLVIRTKNTRPMKELDGQQRQNNLKKAFLLGRNDVKLSTVVIIDDIYTTGNTMDAVARVCKEAGIRQVYFLTVSIGQGL